MGAILAATSDIRRCPQTAERALDVFEHVFEDSRVPTAALPRRPQVTDLRGAWPATPGVPSGPTTLPVLPALDTLLPVGLPRGQAVGVGGSMSLLLALLAAASADGAWCALVDLPVNPEAVAGHGLALDRVALVRAPAGGWSRAGWVTAVGALVDAFDVVAVRPPSRPTPGDAQRLAGRVRTRGALLLPYSTGSTERWPGAALHLHAEAGSWSGLTDTGGGRLRRRRLEVVAARRGQEARPRRASLWLPDDLGAVTVSEPAGAPVLAAVP